MDTNEKFNSIEKTNDEFLAVVQSYDQSLPPNQNLAIRRENDATNRYALFARQNYQSGISQEAFESYRNYHMAQLYNAYINEYSGRASSSQKRLGTPMATDINAVRRMIGDRPGYADYTGPMFLDTETIVAVCHLASLQGSNPFQPENHWSKQLSYGTLTNVIDEMISTKNILLDNAQLEGNPYTLQTGSTIYRQTDITERAIENNTQGYYFSDIQHTESAHSFVSSKTNMFSKIAKQFSNSYKKFNNPERFKEESELLGKKEFNPIDMEGR